MASTQIMEVKGELTTRLTIGFRCHPNYGNDLRRQYQLILADLNDSTLLQSLCSQVAGKHIPVKKLGKLTRQTIMDSNYMLS